jgi:O-acetyl-ADP-ribose deacetylase (regulator of RNase III)
VCLGFFEKKKKMPTTSPSGKVKRERTSISEGFISISSTMSSLKREVEAKTNVVMLPPSQHPAECVELRVWRGDITKLCIDAIVNATNESGLGCFIPNHCIDSAIHSAAGPGLLEECRKLDGVPTGVAKITRAHRLPCKWILHVTGPHAGAAGSGKEEEEEDHEMLARCYRAVLELAQQHGIREIAFCCLSTGIFGFDKLRAAVTALRTVRNWLMKNPQTFHRLVFVVYTDTDENLYRNLFPNITETRRNVVALS